MISSAHICYESTEVHVELGSISEQVENNTNWKTVFTEWSGFGVVVPQLMVLTPTPFIIQIEKDPEWVPEENREFAEWAGLSEDNELYRKLSRCDARLAIQSITPDQVTTTGQEMFVFAFGDTVDPKSIEVSEVLKIIGKKISGVLHDCVNDELLQC